MGLSEAILNALSTSKLLSSPFAARNPAPTKGYSSLAAVLAYLSNFIF